MLKAAFKVPACLAVMRSSMGIGNIHYSELSLADGWWGGGNEGLGRCLRAGELDLPALLPPLSVYI